MKNGIKNRKQSGFTLLESLIATIVLSVGMLGIAALYVEGLKAGRTAVFRTTAVALASDMMDRIRANSAARDDYALGAANGDCVNSAKDCSVTELAQHDVLVWQQEVAAVMPAGTDTDINVALGPPFDQYTITISWPEPGYEEPLSYTLMADM